MYREFFGFCSLPFEDKADTRFLVVTPDTEEALAAMEYEARFGRGMSLVLGEAGTGKTLLIRALLSRLGSTDNAVVLTWAAAAEMSIIREACKGFGVTIPTSYSRNRGLARLRRHLSRGTKQGMHSILIIDQAENLSADNLNQLAALSGLQQAGDRLLTFVLAGQPQFEPTLQHPDYSSINQLLYGRRVLRPLSSEETRHYIRHRLEVAGAADKNLMSRDAMALIHEASQGTPRLINRLCNEALLGAYGAETKEVSVEIASEVCGDLLGPAAETVRPRRRIEHPVAEATAIATNIERHVAPTVATENAGRSAKLAYEPPVHEVRGRESIAAARANESGRRIAGDDAGPSEYSELRGRSVAARLEQLLSQGDGLVSRLERAFAHTERTGITSEAVLLQSAAVEKHLTSLTDDADRVSSDLSRTVQRAAETAGGIEARTHTALEEAQRRAELIEARLARMEDAHHDGDAGIRRMDEACRRAQKVQTELTALAESLADKAQDVQRNVATLVATVSSGEQTRRDLETKLGNAQRDTEIVENRIANLHQDLQRAVAHAEHTRDQLAGKGLDEFGERCAAKLTEVETRAEERLTALQQNLDQAAVRAEQSYEQLTGDAWTAFLTQCRAKIEQLQTQTRASMDAAVATRYSELETMLREVEAGIKRLTETGTTERKRGDELAAQMDRSVKALEEKGRTIVSEHEAAIDAIMDRSMTAREEKGRQIVSEQEAAIDAITRRVDPIAERLETLAAESEQLTQTTDSVDEALANASRTAEGFSKRLETVEAGAAHVLQRAEKGQTSIQRSTEHGENLLADIQVQCGQAEAIQRGMTATLADIGAACERASTVRDGIARGDSLLQKLNEEFRAGQRLLEEMADATQQRDRHAARWEESTRTLCGEADDTIHRLDSHQAAAQQILGKLSGANKDGHQNVQKANDVLTALQRESGSVTEGIERITREVWGLTEKTEVCAAELTRKHAAMTTIMQKIDTTSGPAESLCERLESITDDAGKQVATIEQHCRQVEKLAEQCASMEPLLETAREAQTVLRETADEARERQEELGAVCSVAEEQVQLLDEAHRSSAALMEQHEVLSVSSEQALQSLQETVSGAVDAASRATEILGEFTGGSAQLEQRVGALQTEVAQLEQTLAQCQEQPQRLAARAQAQAEQLARVCAAVKKVFSGLSKATLQARQQAEEMNRASAGATEQFMKIDARTREASHTLHEWTEEATRIQARLERTLQRAPSLAQTHPADALTQASRAITAGPLGVPVGGEIATLTAPRPASPTNDDRGESVTASPHTRTQQVAQLIEDAKRAAVKTPA